MVVTKTVVGFILVFGCDLLWFKVMYAKVYSDPIKKTYKVDEVDEDMYKSGEKVRKGACLWSYAFISAVFSSLLYTPYYPSAIIVGATIGILVFSVFNITTYAVVDKWGPYIMLLDISYGSFVWGLLFLTQRLISSTDIC